jgi:hypothetical protein
LRDGAAHDHGASAPVPERSGQVGGVTAYSMGEVWIPGNHLAAELGIVDSIENGLTYIRNLVMGFGEDKAGATVIAAEHSLVINTGIDNVWDYVRDIDKWALLFPGCKTCEVIDAHHSIWNIKVGTGGLLKTVKVLVCVDQWSGPEKVIFQQTQG